MKKILFLLSLCVLGSVALGNNNKGVMRGGADGSAESGYSFVPSQATWLTTNTTEISEEETKEDMKEDMNTNAEEELENILADFLNVVSNEQEQSTTSQNTQTASVHTQTCGNRFVELGEQCDGGSLCATDCTRKANSELWAPRQTEIAVPNIHPQMGAEFDDIFPCEGDACEDSKKNIMELKYDYETRVDHETAKTATVVKPVVHPQMGAEFDDIFPDENTEEEETEIEVQTNTGTDVAQTKTGDNDTSASHTGSFDDIFPSSGTKKSIEKLQEAVNEWKATTTTTTSNVATPSVQPYMGARSSQEQQTESETKLSVYELELRLRQNNPNAMNNETNSHDSMNDMTKIEEDKNTNETEQEQEEEELIESLDDILQRETSNELPATKYPSIITAPAPWVSVNDSMNMQHGDASYWVNKLPSVHRSATAFVAVPRAGIVAPVSHPKGSDREALLNGLPYGYDDASKQGVVHYPGSSWFDELGRTLIYGHSSYARADGEHDFATIFKTLTQAFPGDKIYVFMKKDDGDFDRVSYTIKEKQKIHETDTAIMGDTVRGKQLALVTCDDFTNADYRRVLIAEQDVEVGTHYGKVYQKVAAKHKLEMKTLVDGILAQENGEAKLISLFDKLMMVKEKGNMTEEQEAIADYLSFEMALNIELE